MNQVVESSARSNKASLLAGVQLLVGLFIAACDIVTPANAHESAGGKTIRHGAQALHGTLVVVAPSKDGIVIAADRKVQTMDNVPAPDRKKIRAVSGHIVITACGCCTIGGQSEKFADSFDVFNSLEKHLKKELERFPDRSLKEMGVRLGELLRVDFQRSFDLLADKKKICSQYSRTGKNFLQSVVLKACPDGKYEALIISLNYASGVRARVSVLADEQLYGVNPGLLLLGSAEKIKPLLVPGNASLSENTRAFMLVGKDWRQKISRTQALTVCAEIIHLANSLEPHIIGPTMDAILLSESRVQILAEDKAEASLMVK